MCMYTFFIYVYGVDERMGGFVLNMPSFRCQFEYPANSSMY